MLTSTPLAKILAERLAGKRLAPAQRRYVATASSKATVVMMNRWFIGFLGRLVFLVAARAA